MDVLPGFEHQRKFLAASDWARMANCAEISKPGVAYPFLYYDPYYEELVRRQKEYSARVPDSKPEDHRILNEELSPRVYMKPAVTNPQLNDSETDPHSRTVPAEIQVDLDSMKKLLESREKVIHKAQEQVSHQERLIKSLYLEVDRLKANISERTEREIKLGKENENLKKQLQEKVKDAHGEKEYKDLEIKYLNAVELIDQLNWKIYQTSST
jgi:regulator of replication initiation timing